jgi:nicotinic acid phosphoribosyltransferase
MSTFNIPFLLDTDTYKLGHPRMYPEGAKELRAYFTCRGPLFDDDERIVVYGLRYAFDTILSRRITQQDIDEADAWLQQHGVANTPMEWPKDLWQTVVDKYDGYIPLQVKALREGSVIYPQIPVFEIIATEIDGDQFQYLVTYLETALMRIWSPMVTATKSAMVRAYLQEKFDVSVDDDFMFLLDSRLHDFGSRGVSSQETAMVTGCAHLTSFDGTDTMIAGWLATKYNDGKHVGTSVLATEHSVMTSWDQEIDAVRRAVEITPKGGICSVVADSYSYQNFLTQHLPIIAPVAQAKGILFVVRPDSGEPVQCVLDGLYACERAFGADTNSKGFKVLRGAAVIQGDGINVKTLMKIADAVEAAGFSAQNVAYGMGGGLLQKQDRDTLKVAIKLCAIDLGNGLEGRMKKPSDDISKTSLPGPFQVNNVSGRPQVYPLYSVPWGDHRYENNKLETIWNHGPTDYKWETIDQVRERIKRDWASSVPKNNEVLSHQMQDRLEKTAKEIRDKYPVGG